MRWTVTVFVVKLLARNASPSTQNTPVFAAAPSVSPGTSAVVPDAALRPAARGGGRRTSAWIGIVGIARISASAVSVPRQPSRPTSHASNGMKIVLASAATSVTTSRARSRFFRGNQPTIAAKAGS